jgi:integrase
VEDIDLDMCIVRVTRQISYPRGGGHTFGPLKSRAGKRVVPIPDLIVPDLRKYLSNLAQSALVFTSLEGYPLRDSNFCRRHWMPALEATGHTGTHFHDLRHTGNQLTSDAGANLREMMARLGHDSTRAALIYQHSTDERQQAIAAQVSKQAKAALRRSKAKADPKGTQRARSQQESEKHQRPDRDSNAGPTA